jgi:predicted ATPase
VHLREGVIEQAQGHWRIKEDVTAMAARIPEGLRPLIGKQFDNLQKEEQRLLEIASVVGAEFGAATIATVLAQPVEAVEELCGKLANTGQFVSESGVEEWPDGTMGGRYRFLHVLYKAIYDRIAEARRVQWHRHIAERKTATYGERGDCRGVSSAL